jgi:hypothetical protein
MVHKTRRSKPVGNHLNNAASECQRSEIVDEIEAPRLDALFEKGGEGSRILERRGRKAIRHTGKIGVRLRRQDIDMMPPAKRRDQIPGEHFGSVAALVA